VWYELLNGNWPFDRQPPESIIWQVGSGLKPSFGTIRGPKEVKVSLLAISCKELLNDFTAPEHFMTGVRPSTFSLTSETVHWV